MVKIFLHNTSTSIISHEFVRLIIFVTVVGVIVKADKELVDEGLICVFVE
jgi:hypothetical protein